jgi:hypothetical protein
MKIEVVTVGGHPFKAGETIVLPMSHPEKAFGLPGKGYEFLGGALGRTYEFSTSSRRVGRALAIAKVEVHPLYRRMAPPVSSGREPEPLPPDERPQPGIYTKHPLLNGLWLRDICVGADGLIYLVCTASGPTRYSRSSFALTATGAGYSRFAVFDVKKGRLTVLERGLRGAQRISSAGNRVYWVEKGTKRRRWRDGRLSVYDIDAKATKVLLEELAEPTDVAAAPDGDAYVLEKGGTLSVVHKGGSERTTIALDSGEYGRLAVGPTGDLFVFYFKYVQPGSHEFKLLRFPSKGGEREVVTDTLESCPEDLAADTKGNVYLVESSPQAREYVSITVLVGGNPRKAVPLSTDKHLGSVAALPNGDLLVNDYCGLWRFEMKKKIEDLVRRR